MMSVWVSVSASGDIPVVGELGGTAGAGDVGLIGT